MNRKTTCLAFAGKCGGLGASGFVGWGSVAPSSLTLKKPSRLSRSIKARPAKPPPISQRNSRRLRPQGVRFGAKRAISIRVDKFVQIENYPTELLESERICGFFIHA